MNRHRRIVMLFVFVLLGGGLSAQQVADVCECAAAELRPFDAGDPATYPAGTIGCATRCAGGEIVIPLPDDGVLRFSRFTAEGQFSIAFAANRGNTPVRLHVAGDVVLRAPACCGVLSVAAAAGTPGTAGRAGTGGAGGTGGYRGGDGHAQPHNNFTPGATGGGPGGGVGATTTIEAIGGTFTGTAELQPLVGGSGGGGGSGSASGDRCTGGGGGGGGGALLVAANGRLTLQNFAIRADGGDGGEAGDRACSMGGAGGSGGAVRLIAGSFVDGGTAQVSARGGRAGYRSLLGTAGGIRIESVDESAGRVFTAEPLARRARVDGR